MAITDFDFTQIFKVESMGFLSTICKESGAIQLNVVSWICGNRQNVLRITVSSKSDIVSNIESNNNVNFSFFYNKSIVSFQNKAKIITKKMHGVPFPTALIELETDELYDIMFYGAEISQKPIYQKTYNIDAAKNLDKQVYDSMALDYEEVNNA